MGLLLMCGLVIVRTILTRRKQVEVSNEGGDVRVVTINGLGISEMFFVYIHDGTDDSIRENRRNVGGLSIFVEL